MEKQIVITHKAEESDRKIYSEMFNGIAGLTYLKDFPEDKHSSIIKNTELLITWNLPKELNAVKNEALSKLKFVQLISAGYDHLKFDIFPNNCIIAANQGAYALPMAEHAVAMILAIEKRLLINHKKLSGGEFDQKTKSGTLREKICGIIGFGSIGKETAKLLRNFGVKIFAVNTSGITDEEVEFIGTLKDFNYVLKNSDIILISIPLSDETRGMFGQKELEIMKPDAVLINVARGAIIQENALYDHLKTHQEFGAGIDAWWIEPFNGGEFKTNYPFFDLPNLLGSPHNSAIIPGALEEGKKRAAENVLNYLTGKPVRGIIQS